jgi:ubiquinone/menaquinone biosynthesis C-methylase UbiE
MESQKVVILDQFTKQARPFATAATMRDKRALELLLGATDAGAGDTVLDVACGPGIVVCAFAEIMRHATGVDLVPAMIEQAQSLQRERGLKNVSWKVADVYVLPYADDSFSIVTSRYAFHHLENPRDVLSEMKWVCKSGGKVALVDVVASADPQRAEHFNQMEKLRDPSHVRALSLSEMEGLFHDVGLLAPKIKYYKAELELESVLKRSFPEEGNAEKVRAVIRQAVENDTMGINARLGEGRVKYSFPIAVLVSEKDA